MDNKESVHIDGYCLYSLNHDKWLVNDDGYRLTDSFEAATVLGFLSISRLKLGWDTLSDDVIWCGIYDAVDGALVYVPISVEYHKFGGGQLRKPNWLESYRV